MLEVALIEKCADPSLDADVVQAFLHAVGNGDPLAVTVKVGHKRILVDKAATPEEALAIAVRYVGRATVRVGVTSYPAHLAIDSGKKLSPALFDSCENLRIGTAKFAKVMRIVAKWYGSNASKDALPYILSDSVHAWVSGEFEGKDVFEAQHPGGLVLEEQVVLQKRSRDTDEPIQVPGGISSAEMRVGLSRLHSNATVMSVK